MGLKKADELLAMYGRVNAIAISIDNIEELKKQESANQKCLANTNLDVLSWDEIMPDFKETIELDNVSGHALSIHFSYYRCFWNSKHCLMSVTERFNEFGITLSIGMPQLKLVSLVLIETIFITIIGLIIGNIIGYGINTYFISHPIICRGYGANVRGIRFSSANGVFIITVYVF